MKLQLENIKRIRTFCPSIIQLCIRDEYMSIYEKFLRHEKNPDGYVLTLDNSVKRSTGHRSQNTHFWGHVEIIAAYYEISKSMAASGIKSLAADELEYPKVINEITKKKEPLSESEASKSDSNKLIEMCHIYAAENGIKLIEYEGEK